MEQAIFTGCCHTHSWPCFQTTYLWCTQPATTGCLCWHRAKWRPANTWLVMLGSLPSARCNSPRLWLILLTGVSCPPIALLYNVFCFWQLPCFKMVLQVGGVLLSHWWLEIMLPVTVFAVFWFHCLPYVCLLCLTFFLPGLPWFLSGLVCCKQQGHPACMMLHSQAVEGICFFV